MEQIGDAGRDDQEPDGGRRLQEGQGGEADDAHEAAADIQRIALDPIGIGVEGPAEHLAGPANISAISTKNRPAIHSIGITNCARSGSRYSVPKNTSCGDAWWPTSTTKPF